MITGPVYRATEFGLSACFGFLIQGKRKTMIIPQLCKPGVLLWI